MEGLVLQSGSSRWVLLAGETKKLVKHHRERRRNKMSGTLCQFCKTDACSLLKLKEKKKDNYQTWRGERAQRRRSSCRLGAKHAQ